MLQFTPLRVMKLRNIDKQFAFLRKLGFSNAITARVLRGQVTTVRLDQLVILCRVLRCELQDLFTYVPDADAPAPAADTLTPLIRPEHPLPDLSTILRELPIDRLEAITRELAATPRNAN